jgi:hypothetical protein
LEEAKSILQEGGYESAVGHQTTADILSTLLGLPVEARRVAITLSPGDRVVVFQILVRLPEGAVLTRDEVLSLYQEGKVSFVIAEVVE